MSVKPQQVTIKKQLINCRGYRVKGREKGKKVKTSSKKLGWEEETKKRSIDRGVMLL